MDKLIYKNRTVEVVQFVNFYKEKMFSIRFRVDSASDDSYRGFKIKDAKKVSKWLKEISEAIESLED